MGWHTAEKGVFIDATTVVRLDCTKCGTVLTTKYPQNDREIELLIKEHARQHGGLKR